jgi:hypothetical protein
VSNTPGALLQPDGIEADEWSALGRNVVWIGDANEHPPVGLQAVVIGLDANGILDCSAPEAFDVLLTSRPAAPAPWVSITGNRLAAHADMLAAAVRDNPIAATMLARTLRLTQRLTHADALDVESMAYSVLLGGAEFRSWRAAQTLSVTPSSSNNELVVWSRGDDGVTISLNDPAHGNAMTAAMRDALYGALVNIFDDPTRPSVRLLGVGRCFSTGGHLPEFGSAQDLAKAHIVRTLHSCARLLHALGDRAHVHLHGACIGSGLEIPAAAHHRIATPDAWFQLPELRMGLIPGAGGTVFVPRAIGRHRTAWMVLSGKRLNATQALAMGLIHAIAPQ